MLPVEPWRALLAALRNMARSRGKGIAGIALAGGQRRVKVDVRALYRYHDEETGYRLIEDILSSMGEEDMQALESRSVRIVRDPRGNTYIELSVELLRDPDKLTL